ncbi:autotransporter outer membrane beta-barrel domain-containing protein [Terasakiella pusilla]|uniref:autotransporter outer membrane beta-barrel domain-containing protein n=1 Tax=Terasakiella pusilla TaxID=64973 RepID=UPI003AA7DC25
MVIQRSKALQKTVFSLLVFLGSGFATSLQAETINCTGVGSEDTSNTIFIIYNQGPKTCALATSSGALSTGGIQLHLRPSSGGNSTGNSSSDNNLDAGFSTLDHAGVTSLGGNDFAAGANTVGTILATGSHTTTITSKVSADTTGVMTVSYTVVANTSIDVTAASVQLTVAGGSSSSSSGTSSTPASLHASVSRSQTTVVSTNIGTRLASVGRSPVGVGRTVPSGNAPTSSEGTLPSPNTEQVNFASLNYESSSSNAQGYDKLPLRQLAMAMSFDSSEMILAAAGDENTPVLAPEKRADLLAERPLTVWGHGSFTDITNTRNDASRDSRYGGDVWGYNLGLDYRLTSNFYVGTSVGFSQTDLTTTYNSGTYDEDSWTITPYAVFKPSEAIKISGMFGYGFSDIDQTRNSGSITSSTRSATWFGALNGAYTIKPAKELPLEVKASVGFLASNKKVDAYTESNGTEVRAVTSNTRQIKPGLEVAYSYSVDDNTVMQPFVKTDWVHDFKDPVNDDANAFDVGGGLRIGSTTGFNGSLEGKTQLGRSDYKEHSISGMVAYGFTIGADKTGKASFIEPYVESDFSKDAQSMGTGLNFRSHNDAVQSKLSLSQTAAHDSDVKSMNAKLTLDVKF